VGLLTSALSSRAGKREGPVQGSRSLAAAGGVFFLRFRLLGIFIAFSPGLSEKFGALSPRHRARPLDLGGDVVGYGIDLKRLQCSVSTDRFQVAEIRRGHIVAALVGIGEAVEMRHRRARPPALYDLTDLISGELRRPQRETARALEARDMAVARPPVALRASGLARQILCPVATSCATAAVDIPTAITPANAITEETGGPRMAMTTHHGRSTKMPAARRNASGIINSPCQSSSFFSLASASTAT